MPQHTIKDTDNFSTEYQAYRNKVQARQNEVRFNEFIGQTDTAFTDESELSVDPQTQSINPDSMGKTISKNVIELLPQALAGPVDTINEVIGVIDELADTLVDLGLPDAFMQFRNPKTEEIDFKFLTGSEAEGFRLLEEAGLPKVPIEIVVGKPDTATGLMAREITKFLAGMLPAVKGIKALRGTAAVRTTFTEAASGSAIASAVVQDPHEDRLSAFLNEVPFLSVLVPDYLADNNPENESRWEARLKNAVEDAGLGVLVESLVRTFKYIKLARKAKREAGPTDPLERTVLQDKAREAAIQQADEISLEQLAGLGSPGSPTMFTRRPKELGGRLKEAQKRVADAVGIPKPKSDIFINMARIEAPDDVVKLIKDVADADAAAINRKRGGKTKSLKRMIDESDLEFQELKDLIGRDPGPMSAAEALAARKVLTTSGEQLAEFARKANSATSTSAPADMYSFRRALAVHYAIQSEVIAARTETARALRSWAIPAGTDKQRGEAIAELIQQSGDGKSTKEMAAAIANMGTDQLGINGMTRELMRAKRFDAIYQFWVNNILSGPQTHMVNVLSNSFTAMYAIPENMVNAAISKVFYDGEISFLEAQAKAFGLVKGVRDGIRLVAHGRKAEGVGDLTTQFEQFSKIETIHGNNITADVFGVDPAGKFGRGIDYLGQAANLPTTLLRTEDKFFKAIGYRMELNSLAIREGISDGLEGKKLAERVNDILNNPPPNLKADAIDMAHYQTFTDPFQAKNADFVAQLRSYPGIRYIAPFVRTPGNILSYSFERTPLTLLSRKFKADVAAGGPRAASAWGRMMTGSMIMMTIADMTLEGTITGPGPKNPKLLSNLKETGWRPFSIKVGNRFIPYNRLDPVGSLFAFGAWYGEMVNNMDDGDQDFALTAALTHFSEVLSSKTYLSGIFGFIGALDPKNHGNTVEGFVQNVASGFVPFSSLLNTMARTIDPKVRLTRGALGDGDGLPILPEGSSLFIQNIMNRIQSRIPGWSESLPLRRDLAGKEIDRASGYGTAFDFLSPIYASVADPNEWQKVIIDNKIPVSHVSKTIFDVELQPLELSEYQRIAGELLDMKLTKLIKERQFQDGSNGPDGLKSSMILNVVNATRDIARAQMLIKFPRIDQVRKEKLLIRKSQLTGEPVEQDNSVSAPVIPVSPGQKDTTSVRDILSGR